MSSYFACTVSRRTRTGRATYRNFNCEANQAAACTVARTRLGLCVQRLRTCLVEALGGLHILVSNAGRQQAHASILDISSEQFDWTMKTNIYAPFWIIKAAIGHLTPGACIIATTSEQPYDPTPDLDATAGQRRCIGRKAEELWKSHTARTARHARRARRHLCAAGGQSQQFCHRAGLWVGRRCRAALRRRPTP